MICRQRTRLLAFLQAEWIPMLANSDCTSASIPLSQMVRGRPRGLLQSPGGLSDALIVQWRSCLEYEHATWQNKRSHLVLKIVETGRHGSLSDRSVGNHWPGLRLSSSSSATWLLTEEALLPLHRIWCQYQSSTDLKHIQYFNSLPRNGLEMVQ